MISERIENWIDLGYTCVAVPGIGDRGNVYMVEWKIVKLFAGRDANGKEAMWWQGRGSDSMDDLASSPSDAQTFIQGTTKWDGCTDWIVVEEGYVHACSRDDLLGFGQLLARVHDLCGHMMPDRDLGFHPKPLPAMENE